MDDKDLLIENILSNAKKDKTKVDGKAKGNRTERNLCELLTKHFGTEFTKAPGSGALATIRESLPEHAKKTLTGDLCVPEKFKWVIESKGGYEKDIDLTNALDGNPVPRLDEFITQSSRDAEYCGRKPLICWKRNRKPWLAMIRVKDLTENHDDSICEFEDYTPYRLYYRDWIMISLDHLLKSTSKDFWFDK
jgi:Holliday junction resolvase